MAHEGEITAREAEQLVRDRIETFGLDALPAVSVLLQPDARWRIEWRGRVHVAQAMTRSQWEDWLERNVGPVSPERLASTEG
jgi:hypothetical protein